MTPNELYPLLLILLASISLVLIGVKCSINFIISWDFFIAAAGLAGIAYVVVQAVQATS